MAWLSWKVTAEENVPNLPHTHEVIGAYVTAGARIHLYGFLDRLQEKAIYCDTDSVIFIQPSGEPWPIATGDKLRDMQSEIKPSEFVVEFVSGGLAKLSRLEICEFRGNQGHDFGTRRIRC